MQKPGDWAAQSPTPRRSLFSNFKSESAEVEDSRGLRSSGGERAQSEIRNPKSEIRNSESLSGDAGSVGANPNGLQVAIDAAVARAFVYQFLARAFDDPAPESWAWLTDEDTHAALRSAVRIPAVGTTELEATVTTLGSCLRRDRFEPFRIAYVTAFGHAARGDCPLNEIEYGDLKADPLFQPHRLADLAAFYRAFGLEVADGAAERPDHIGMELEFMSVLAAKEAYALEHQLDGEPRQLCRDAQKKFLREHLGRWSLAFARRLARTATDEALAALAEFLRAFVARECARFGVTAGSEDLLLRPVDEQGESLCTSCGLQNLPPGANTTCATS